MEIVATLAAVLAGWAIRKKAAEILRIRKTNQAHRRTLRALARGEKSWKQIRAVGDDYAEAVICR